MSVNTIFGINGVGKDAVASELKKENPKITVTSMSRLLMYLLGISQTYDAAEKITEAQYKKLEEVPQKDMIELEQQEYRALLEDLTKQDDKVLILAHLISALRHGDETEYLTNRQIPDWFVDINENLVQLVAPPEVILERRLNDTSRNRKADISQIVEHQSLCDDEWERIGKSKVLVKRKMHVIPNLDLGRTTREVRNVISR